MGDNFSDFARLMLNGTFSLKNYTNRQVVLKPVTDLRVLIELLPSLIPNPMARKGAISSFILALSHRLSGPVNTYPSTTNRSQVYQTLGELSYIHRLTGRGQSYIGIVDTEGYEMNTLEY
ncbi:MAG: hypothetical protein J5881_03155 [Clostridia bacterium]|nr:hypothetical protein [Clostridia bacterium]